MGNLMEKYNGSFNLLHCKASTAKDLENGLKNLGTGIGDVTVTSHIKIVHVIAILIFSDSS